MSNKYYDIIPQDLLDDCDFDDFEYPSWNIDPRLDNMFDDNTEIDKEVVLKKIYKDLLKELSQITEKYDRLMEPFKENY